MKSKTDFKIGGLVILIIIAIILCTTIVNTNNNQDIVLEDYIFSSTTIIITNIESIDVDVYNEYIYTAMIIHSTDTIRIIEKEYSFIANSNKYNIGDTLYYIKY